MTVIDFNGDGHPDYVPPERQHALNGAEHFSDFSAAESSVASEFPDQGHQQGRYEVRQQQDFYDPILVIHVYDAGGNVIETHEHAGDFVEP